MAVGKSLQIQLEDLRRPEWRALYIGDRQRLATATSVRFVDPITIVCCSLLGRKIYLVRFDLGRGSYEVLDHADTVFADEPTETDLCDVVVDDRGRAQVVTSNCETGSMSLYRIVDHNKIRFERDLVRLGGDFCHGARFIGTDVVVATTLRTRGAHFFDRRTMRETLFVPTARPAKDIVFLRSDRAALITTSSEPRPEPTEGQISEIVVVDFDLRRGRHSVRRRQTFPAGQFDSAAFFDKRLFVVDSYRGSVLVLDRRLRQVDQIDGYDFPHGVDVNHGMIAVACYGTNSIHVSTL